MLQRSIICRNNWLELQHEPGLKQHSSNKSQESEIVEVNLLSKLFHNGSEKRLELLWYFLSVPAEASRLNSCWCS